MCYKEENMHVLLRYPHHQTCQGSSTITTSRPCRVNSNLEHSDQPLEHVSKVLMASVAAWCTIASNGSEQTSETLHTTHQSQGRTCIIGV
jgi:hypothetical protein